MSIPTEINVNSYVLITSAYNEEKYITATIDSILKQNIIPDKWIIVSDGSTDSTDQIIQKYSFRHSFIKYIRLEKEKQRVGFASKVHALNIAVKLIGGTSYEFLGNLDADITFESNNYFQKLIDRFHVDPKLGISGGTVFEFDGYKYKKRSINNIDSVAGAIQFFRKKCLEDIGGFLPIDVGGEDWIAEITARLKGWKVSSDPELIVYHHKKGNEVRGGVKEGIREGKMDYLVGSHPLFEILKCAKRIKQKPYFVRAVIRVITYYFLTIIGRERFVSKEIMEQLRKEQKVRMRLIYLDKYLNNICDLR